MPCTRALTLSLAHTSSVACVHIGGCTPVVERRVMPFTRALSLSLAHTSSVACVHIGGCTSGGGGKRDAVHPRAHALTSTHVLRRVRAYRGMHTCGGAKSDAVHARALALTSTHVLRRVRAYRGMHIRWWREEGCRAPARSRSH